MPRRDRIAGHPHTYAVDLRCALGLPLLGDPGEAEAFIAGWQAVRHAFDARCFAYRVEPARVLLIVAHRPLVDEDDATLQARWAATGGGAMPRDRLYARLTSLSGLMQTLAQRTSRARGRRRATSGGLWQPRFRSCLLADDTAVLAATAWVEQPTTTTLASSRGAHASTTSPVTLAPPPLVAAPDGAALPAGEAPPGLTPPLPADRQVWLDRFVAGLSPAAIAAYGSAIAHGWALGKPESLAEAVARLGRVGGRGRSRGLRELADDLGLCGVWG